MKSLAVLLSFVGMVGGMAALIVVSRRSAYRAACYNGEFDQEIYHLMRHYQYGAVSQKYIEKRNLWKECEIARSYSKVPLFVALASFFVGFLLAYY